MRHLVYLFLVSTSLTIGFSETSHAISVKEVDKAGIYQPIVDAINNRFDQQVDLDGKASEENTTGRARAVGQQGEQANAVAANTVKTTQENAVLNTHNKTMNLDSYACSYVTSAGGVSGAVETAAMVIAQSNAARMSKIAGAPGTPTENGLVDFQNQLFDQMQTLGPERFSIGALFTEPNIQVGGADAAQLEYLQDLLYARIPTYLNQDLLDNADTETKNLSVQADRLRSEMGIGQTVFSILKGNRAPSTVGYNSAEFLKQILESNGYSGDWADKLFPASGASLRAQLEGLTMGQFGAGYSTEKLVDNPEVIGAGVLFNSMLTNVLLFKQYELLETIAASTSTQVIATREQAIKDVNARISRKNARQ